MYESLEIKDMSQNRYYRVLKKVFSNLHNSYIHILEILTNTFACPYLRSYEFSRGVLQLSISNGRVLPHIYDTFCLSNIP